MKFNKILTVEIPPFKLNREYWRKIDDLCLKRVNLSKASPDIISDIKDTDCLLTGFGVTISRKLISHAPLLKYIGVLATSYSGIDTEYTKRKNIFVSNIPGYATESVAEFAFAVILNYLRNLVNGTNQAKLGNYSESGFRATEIKNKKFGIIGLGKIGARVAEIAQGFGADVSYWSRNRKKYFEKRGINYRFIDDLISQSDFLSLHLSLTMETRNFLDSKRISRIKKGAVVVNLAPMELVDIKALSERLTNDDLTFILDHSDEMAKKDLLKLSKYSNCLIYPPIAYISEEAKAVKQEIFFSNIEHFLNGKPQNIVKVI